MGDSRDPWYDDFVRRLDRAQDLGDIDALDDEPVQFPLRCSPKDTNKKRSHESDDNR